MAAKFSRRFEKFVLDYQPRLMAYTMRFVNDRIEAQDIVQNSFVKLWEKYPQAVDDYPRLVFTITRNECLNYIKHLQMERDTFIILPTSSAESLYNFDFRFEAADEPFLYSELESQLCKVLESLPERCRQVFELSRYEGLKNREIADRLNISVSAVEQHITRALKSFARILDK